MNNKKVPQHLNFLSLLVVSVTLIFVVSCSNTTSASDTITSNCPTKKCTDFSTQATAQATFNSDRTCYKSLDADSDGTACETLL